MDFVKSYFGTNEPLTTAICIFNLKFWKFAPKMTFSYCYIGHICLTFRIASLQTSMIFGGFGRRRTMLWTFCWTLCIQIEPLDHCYLHFQFKILKICSKNDINLQLHSSYLPHFPNCIVANFELRLWQQM